MEYSSEVYGHGDPLQHPDRHDIAKLYPEMQLARGAFTKRILGPNEDIADICCGTGFMSALLPHNSYSGVDHPEMVDIIHSKGHYLSERVNFIPYDFENASGDLDLAREVDTVISFESIEHVSDPQRFLAQIRRNTKEGGQLILSTPNNPKKDPPKYVDHVEEYSLSELTSMVEEAGYSSIESYAMGVPLGLAVRMLQTAGAKTTRYDTRDERGKFSLALDHLLPLRRLARVPFRYHLLGERFGDTGTTLLIRARAE